MVTIEDAWLDERVKDMIASRDQVEALKNYFSCDISADEATRVLAASVDRAAKTDTSSAEDIVEQLCLLWTLIIDVLSDWPQLHSEVVLLLDAFRKLPHIDRAGQDSIESFRDDAGVVREAGLWQDLPKFWNLFSDHWDALCAWRNGGQRPDVKDAGSPSWSNTNAFAAVAFKSEAFRGMKFLGERGCWVLRTSAAPTPDLTIVDIPAAAGWIRIAGPEIYDFYMSNLTDSSPGQWKAWQVEFTKVANDTNAKESTRNDAAAIAAAMHDLGGET